MSKNTKIIAIIGGILILGGLIYMGTSKGGFGAAFEAIGCGGKKADQKPRVTMNLEDKQFNDCRGFNYVCKRDAKGQIVRPAKGKPCTKLKGADYCTKLWVKKCGDAKFKKSYSTACKKRLKAKAKDDDDDDE